MAVRIYYNCLSTALYLRPLFYSIILRNWLPLAKFHKNKDYFI